MSRLVVTESGQILLTACLILSIIIIIIIIITIFIFISFI